MPKSGRLDESHYVNGPARGAIANVLAQARASLKEPLSRPYTPAETRGRGAMEYDRPGSSLSGRPSSSAFGQENLERLGLPSQHLGRGNGSKDHRSKGSRVGRGLPGHGGGGGHHGSFLEEGPAMHASSSSSSSSGAFIREQQQQQQQQQQATAAAAAALGGSSNPSSPPYEGPPSGMSMRASSPSPAAAPPGSVDSPMPPRSREGMGSSSSAAAASSAAPSAAPSAPPPAWVREMDDVIEELDLEMTELNKAHPVNLKGGGRGGVGGGGGGSGGASSLSVGPEETKAVRALLSQLWPTVDAMASACSDGDERWVLQRNRLFACLFRVLERRESELRIPAARCVLRLLSAGRASKAASLQLPKYEAAVCKVLFQLTRASKNDATFFDAGAVQPMLSLLEAQALAMDDARVASSSSSSSSSSPSPPMASPSSLSDASKLQLPMEAPIFLAGALKNISAADSAQRRLGQLGAVSVFCGLLHTAASLTTGGTASLSSSSSSSGGAVAALPCSEKQQAQLLVQVTGALRNLSLDKSHYRQLAACGAPAMLCRLAGNFVGHRELMFNVARVLAKLSLHESLRAGINADQANLGHLLDLLEHTGTTGAIDESLPLLNDDDGSASDGGGGGMSSGSSGGSSGGSSSGSGGGGGGGGVNGSGVGGVAGRKRRRPWSPQQLSQPVALMVRVAFTLGNLTASNERNRVLVGRSFGGAATVAQILAAVHAHYSHATTLLRQRQAADAIHSAVTDDGGGGGGGEGKEAEGDDRRGEGKEADDGPKGGERRREREEGKSGDPPDGAGGTSSSSSSSVAFPLATLQGTQEELEELLVKLIRLLANLSISAEVGPLIVSQPGVGVLVSLLDQSLAMRREELLLNVVSAITNLSYYPDAGYAQLARGAEEKDNDDDEDNDNDDNDGRKGRRRGAAKQHNYIFGSHQRLCSDLVEVLLHDNEEAVAEAARAFGNFSREPEVRLHMARCRADEALAILLDHAHRDVVFAAAGALVNVGADPAVNAVLVAHPDMCGCGKLVAVMRRAGLRDLPMAAVACKALYNTLLDVTQRAAAREGGLGVGGGEDGEGEGSGGDGDAETRRREQTQEVLWATQDAVGGSDALELLHRSLDELLDAAESAASQQQQQQQSGDGRGGRGGDGGRRGGRDAHGTHDLQQFMAAGGALHGLVDDLLRRAFEDSNEYEDLDPGHAGGGGGDYKK